MMTKSEAACAAVERLANVQMNISLAEWSELSSTILAALAKPASSPAGGDVVQTLIDKTEKLIEAADDMGWSCNSSSADQAIREAKDAVRAALSQSTSAGRVGDGS